MAVDLEDGAELAFREPCVPAGSQASNGEGSGPVWGGFQPIIGSFLSWVASIPVGRGGGGGWTTDSSIISWELIEP